MTFDTRQSFLRRLCRLWLILWLALNVGTVISHNHPHAIQEQGEQVGFTVGATTECSVCRWQTTLSHALCVTAPSPVTLPLPMPEHRQNAVFAWNTPCFAAPARAPPFHP